MFILNNLFKTEILTQLCAVSAEITRHAMSVQRNTKGCSRKHFCSGEAVSVTHLTVCVCSLTLEIRA